MQCIFSEVKKSNPGENTQVLITINDNTVFNLKSEDTGDHTCVLTLYVANSLSRSSRNGIVHPRYILDQFKIYIITDKGNLLIKTENSRKLGKVYLWMAGKS